MSISLVYPDGNDSDDKTKFINLFIKLNDGGTPLSYEDIKFCTWKGFNPGVESLINAIYKLDKENPKLYIANYFCKSIKYIHPFNDDQVSAQTIGDNKENIIKALNDYIEFFSTFKPAMKDYYESRLYYVLCFLIRSRIKDSSFVFTEDYKLKIFRYFVSPHVKNSEETFLDEYHEDISIGDCIKRYTYYIAHKCIRQHRLY